MKAPSTWHEEQVGANVSVVSLDEAKARLGVSSATVMFLVSRST